MFSSKSIFATALLAISALAAPVTPTCSTEKAIMALPDSQTLLAKQSGPPSFALLGVGVQNYTCGADGKFASAGAVAELFDISCLAGKPAFNTVQDTAMRVWSTIPDRIFSSKLAPLITAPLGCLSAGKHYFTKNAAGGISPVWDMRTTGLKSVQGKAGAYVLAAKVANIPAPTGAQDVDWLQLKNVEGQLATAIYRTDTRGGPAPASCTAGQTLSVKYTSKYFLFGSTVA
ncbi:hypothetical protein FA13DRAFT_1786951 [Coprinellus micaceus]|uniref:Malate dehydrogenase n=1 Tax=Coprinellus micaceus TaxID=71717 RepID=A0A4Y7TSJ1_COPMI|nr:hypothetical protein FA13DRAFT_1786951 [Coprinellus micaceus]